MQCRSRKRRLRVIMIILTNGPFIVSSKIMVTVRNYSGHQTGGNRMDPEAASVDLPCLRIKDEIERYSVLAFNHFLANLLYPLGDVVPGKLLNMLPTGCPHVLTGLLGGDEVANCLVEFFFRIDEKARSAMDNRFC